MCPQCGTREEEWQPEAGGDRHAYVVTTNRCFGCQLLERHREGLPEGPAGAGLKLGLVDAEQHALYQHFREQQRQHSST
ncbi:hypothetical protein ACIF6L_34710 [Kitasatospora sp. NPDC086009]|uniref:hypothetical protein n=1 Tax=unclassified Kitasatospora TaxID=2633591 RepID=UPI0037C852C6